MTAPGPPGPPPIDPSYVPPYFDMYLIDFSDQETAATLCPTNAVDPRDSSYVHVGKVDGPTLYGYGGLGKKNPFPNPWVEGEGPVAPFAYGTPYTVIYEGDDPRGGHVRACVKEVTYAKNTTTGKVTGNAVTDDYSVRAYWHYEPPEPEPAP